MNPLLRQSLIAGYVCIASCLGATRGLADDAPANNGHQAAVWRKHEYSFAFMGFTSTYSCDGLADKVRVLLLAAGARSDVKSRPGACAGGFGRPDKFARAELTFYTLVPATSPDAGDQGAIIDGIWRAVAFATHRPQELTTGDCELMEQFKSSILPLFTTRNVEAHTVCVPYQNAGSLIDLRFESLATVPQKAKQDRKTSAEKS